MQPTEHRYSGGHSCQPKIDRTYELLTVHLIGEHAGGQGEQKERERSHSRHEANQNRRAGGHVHHPGRRAIVGGHAGSGDHGGNPESSESRISQGRPSGTLSHHPFTNRFSFPSFRTL